jgi:hypothetical protein
VHSICERDWKICSKECSLVCSLFSDHRYFFLYHAC